MRLFTDTENTEGRKVNNEFYLRRVNRNDCGTQRNVPLSMQNIDGFKSNKPQKILRVKTERY